MNTNYNSLNNRLLSLFKQGNSSVESNKATFKSGLLSSNWFGTLVVLLLFLVGNDVWSQVNLYTFSQSSGTYTAISGGTVSGSGAALDDDIFSVTLPTAFLYNGNNVTTVGFSANGYLILGSTTSHGYTPLSNTTTSNGVIAAMGMDLVANSASSDLRWEQIGNEIIFQWNDFKRYNATAFTNENFSFQIRLNTVSKVITIVYNGSTNVNTSTTRIPQVGLRGTLNTDYNARRLTTTVPDAAPAWNDTAAATSNGHNVRFTSTGACYPAAGQTFTWTPPVPPSCGVPLSLSVTDVQTTTADLNWATPASGTPASYDWEIRTSGVGGSGATGLTASGNVTAPTVTVNDAAGLTENVAYNFYVRTNCTGGDGSSAWSGPIAFTTKKSCPAGLGAGSVTIASLPYSATGLTNSGAGNNVTATNVSCVSGSSNYYSAEDKTYIFTPSSTGVHTILLTTATDDDAGIMLYQGCPFTTGSVCVANAQATTGLTRTLTPTLTSGVTYYLVVDNWTAPAFIASYSLSITPPASCEVPTGITVSDITGTTADLTWVAPSSGTPDTYDWEVRTTGAGGSGSTGLVASGNVTAPTVTVNDVAGLSSKTTYSVYVRTNCASGAGSSLWAGPINFTTLLDCASAIALTSNTPVTSGNLATSGSAYSVSACGFSTLGNEALYSYTAPISGVYTLNISSINGGSGYIDYFFKNSTAGCGPTGWTCIDDNNGTGTDTFTLVGGETYFILLDAESASGTANHTFSIDAPSAPSCVAAPTAPTDGGNTCSATTTLSWPAVATATSYDVYLDSVLVSDNQTGTTYSATVADGAHTWSVVPSNAIGDATGCADFTFTKLATPAGDTFATAIDLGVVTSSTSVNGDNQSSNCWNNDYTTSSTPGNAANARPGNDVFYKFEITECGSLMDIGTCTSSFDTYIHLLDSTGTRINGDDDSCTTPNTTGSFISTLALTPGVYYVVVEGYASTDMGTFTLDLTYVAGTPIPTWYADVDGDTFGDSTVSSTGCEAPANYVAASGDCNDNNPAINPGATEVCYDGIDNNCNGTIDEGCTPIVTVVQSAQCGSTLTTIDQYIYANLVSGAQGYRFRVTDMTTNQVQTIDKALRVFQLTQLGNYAFNRTYQVEVSVRYANVWQPFYGLPCTVTTPATTTQIQSAQCNSTLTNMNDIIYANNVPFAAGYRFRITNLLTSAQHVVDRPVRDVRMSNTSIAEFNSTYSVEVAVKNTDGSYLPYGTGCNITTPSFPTSQLQTTQCDVVIANMNTTIYADSYTGASTYRFRFTSGTFTYTFDRPTRSFILNTVPGLQPSTVYTVQVALEINGVFGPYGKTCTITTPGSAKAVAASVAKFEVVSYPNPFGDSFQLDVNTTSEDKLEVRVYDMIGKLIENKTVEAIEINSIQLGAAYPSGVYNVIVSQGSDVKTLRVIKR